MEFYSPQSRPHTFWYFRWTFLVFVLFCYPPLGHAQLGIFLRVFLLVILLYSVLSSGHTNSYFWGKHLFLGDTLIFGRYTYFWVIHLFLGDKLIFGLYTYFWAIHFCDDTRRTPDGHRTDTGQTPDGHRTDTGRTLCGCGGVLGRTLDRHCVGVGVCFM